MINLKKHDSAISLGKLILHISLYCKFINYKLTLHISSPRIYMKAQFCTISHWPQCILCMKDDSRAMFGYLMSFKRNYAIKI